MQDTGIDLHFPLNEEEKYREQSVFELIAAGVHRTSAFEWVRHPKPAKKKRYPEGYLFFLRKSD